MTGPNSQVVPQQVSQMPLPAHNVMADSKLERVTGDEAYSTAGHDDDAETTGMVRLWHNLKAALSKRTT